MSDLRPTLFLAQLSNLLAGNISIVHGVTGSSRTFMGEEAAGVDAVRIALCAHRCRSERHRAGRRRAQWRAPRPADALRVPADICLKDQFRPVWERGRRAALRSARSAPSWFWRAREHAEARGAKPFARLSAVLSRPLEPPARRRHRSAWRSCGTSSRRGLKPASAAIISGATGAEPATGEERAFLAAHADLPVRATGTISAMGSSRNSP